MENNDCTGTESQIRHPQNDTIIMTFTRILEIRPPQLDRQSLKLDSQNHFSLS